jgi:uncharacterized protein (DUF885 family)
MPLRPVLLFATLLLCCAHPGPPAAPAGPSAPADSTAAAQLKALGDEYWEYHLRVSPFQATLLGDRRYDGEVPDDSPAGLEAEAAHWRAFLDRARQIPEAALPVEDRVTRAVLVRQLEDALSSRECHFERWLVDHLDGDVMEVLNLPSVQRSGTPEDRERLLQRWRKLPAYLDQDAANLKMGLAEGKVGTQDSVTRELRELDKLLAQPSAEWVLVQQPLSQSGLAAGAPERAAFQKRILETIDSAGGVREAFARYRQLVKSQLAPKARPDDRFGLKWVAGGSDCYPRLVRMHTTLDLGPEALHQLGLDELKRIEAELSALGKKALGTADLKEIQRRMRSDRSLFFTTREEIEAKGRSALAAAQAATPRWFGRLPRTPCEVKRIEPHEEADATVAYYRRPAGDGSRPGTYYLNTFAPETRPRYEAEALAFHEAVPGHHLQIAMAMELPELPAFRRNSGATAFVEGWALYTERLADEMGLYSSDLDRLGMLSFDAWRACRLVVDTGIHAMGWSRPQAIQFMLEHSVLAENNVVNEVSRYAVNPGQALAYKAGQLELVRLRQQAQRRLGARFDIRAFHDEVLRHGAVGLSVLREQVERWIAAQERGPGG